MTRQLASAALLAVLSSLGSLAGTALASTLPHPEKGTAAPAVGLAAADNTPGMIPSTDAVTLMLADSSHGDALLPGNGAEGAAHVWATPIFGGVIGKVNYPAITYIGFESMLRSQRATAAYNENNSILSNAHGAFASTAAPEPASLALLGTGAFGAVALLRRRAR